MVAVLPKAPGRLKLQEGFLSLIIAGPLVQSLEVFVGQDPIFQVPDCVLDFLGEVSREVKDLEVCDNVYHKIDMFHYLNLYGDASMP